LICAKARCWGRVLAASPGRQPANISIAPMAPA
jgi:hypothetical protein